MANFLTRVKFINPNCSLYQSPQSSSPMSQGSLSRVPRRRQQLMELLSDYFNPFSTHVFVIHSYNEKNQSMSGYLRQTEPEPIVRTALKLASYCTLLFPLIAFTALLALNGSIRYVASPDNSKKAAHALLSCFHKHQVEIKKPSLLAYSRSIEAINAHTQIGGEILLGQKSVWVSFKPIKDHEGSYILNMKAMQPKEKEESAILACARADYSAPDQQITLSQVQVNSLHPYLYKSDQEARVNFHQFDAAPESISSILESLGKSLFLAAIRLLSSKLHFIHATTQLAVVAKAGSSPLIATPATTPLPPLVPMIRVIGDLSTLLTHDGQQRVVSDKFYIPANDLLPATIQAPCHLYEQIAFQEMLLATVSKKEVSAPQPSIL